MKNPAARWLALGITLLLPGIVHAQDAAPSEPGAQHIFELTNQERSEHGLQPLRWDASLAAAAQTHAARMAQEKSLSHQYPGEPDVPARAAQAGARFQAIAENTAVGPDAEAIERQWMKSTAHRTNILDPQMNAIGIATAERGGYVYAVEDFSKASEMLTKDQVEQRIGSLLHDRNIDPSGPRDAAEQACATGEGVPQGSPAHAIVRFETPDLSRLPSEVARQLRSGEFTRAAVGACPAQHPQGSFAIYRVAVLLY